MDKHEEKWGRKMESSYIVARLLSALKCFYTFKKLEEKLNIPSQILWRYTSFTSRPEKRTAKNILRKIEELKLIENVFQGAISVNSMGYVETWRYLYNPRFLDLIGYIALKTFQNNVTTVLTYPVENVPLAIVISTWLNSRVCVVDKTASLNSLKYFHTVYPSIDQKSFISVYIPKAMLKKGDKVLVVKNVVKNWQSLEAIKRLARDADAEIVGALAVVSISNEWRKVVEKLKIENVKIIVDLSNTIKTVKAL